MSWTNRPQRFVTGTRTCTVCDRNYPKHIADDPGQPEVGETCLCCTPKGGERLREWCAGLAVAAMVFMVSPARAEGTVTVGPPAWVTPDSTLHYAGPTGVERCSISQALRVSGPDRQPCIEFLETALRLARAEALVNRQAKRKRRK